MHALSCAHAGSGAGEARDLCVRLAELERVSGGAPIVSVSNGEPDADWEAGLQGLVDAEAFLVDSDGEDLGRQPSGKPGEDWELL